MGNYIQIHETAYRRYKERKLSGKAWLVYSELFFRANRARNLTGPVRMTTPEAAVACGVSEQTFIACRAALVEAGMIVYEPGGPGKGNKSVYMLVDLPSPLTGTLTVVEPPEPPEPVQQAMEPIPDAPEPVQDGLFGDIEAPPEKPKKARKTKAETLIKRPYGAHGRIMLTDRDVKYLDNRYPDWKNYLQAADDWLDRTGATKKDYYSFLLNWIKRDKARQPAPEPQQELEDPELVAAAKRIEQESRYDWLGGD